MTGANIQKQSHTQPTAKSPNIELILRTKIAETETERAAQRMSATWTIVAQTEFRNLVKNWTADFPNASLKLVSAHSFEFFHNCCDETKTALIVVLKAATSEKQALDAFDKLMGISGQIKVRDLEALQPASWGEIEVAYAFEKKKLALAALAGVKL